MTAARGEHSVAAQHSRVLKQPREIMHHMAELCAAPNRWEIPRKANPESSSGGSISTFLSSLQAACILLTDEEEKFCFVRALPFYSHWKLCFSGSFGQFIHGVVSCAERDHPNGSGQQKCCVHRAALHCCHSSAPPAAFLPAELCEPSHGPIRP